MEPREVGRSVGAAESRAVGAVGRRGRSARVVGGVGLRPEGPPTKREPWAEAHSGKNQLEADPIGRRLECRPKKEINILININPFFGETFEAPSNGIRLQLILRVKSKNLNFKNS